MEDQARIEISGDSEDPTSEIKTPPVGPIQHPLDYTGQAKSLGWLVFKNTILTVITLGFYRFWAKTRIRKYIWSNQSLFGEPLEYTGTGKELFLGFLIVLAVLVPLGIVVNVISFYIQTKGNLVAAYGFQAVYSLIFIFLFGYAVFRARRYQLSRTVWRGIRFVQTGVAKKYAVKFFGYTLLTVATLGLTAPLATVRLQTYLTDNTFLGQKNFSLDAKVKDMFWKWLICIVLIPFTLGFSLLWYLVFSTRYLVGKTSFGPLKLSLPVTFGNFAKIYITYYLVLLLLNIVGFLIILMFIGAGAFKFETGASVLEILIQMQWLIGVFFLVLFLIAPSIAVMMITHRFLGLYASKLETVGELDLNSFIQNAQEASRTGEGLADALDVGGGAGIEIGL